MRLYPATPPRLQSYRFSSLLHHRFLHMLISTSTSAALHLEPVFINQDRELADTAYSSVNMQTLIFALDRFQARPRIFYLPALESHT